MSMPADPYLLALCSLPLLGPVTQRRLIRAFGSPEGVFRAPAGDLARVEGVSTKRAGSIARFYRWKALEMGIERVRAGGARVVTFDDAGDDAGYPGVLRALGEDAPLVLGSGMDVPNPPENRGLMERLTHSGAVVTEFPPGTRPLPENFPRRNRLISGLSLGVLVVEAGEKSGALITAEHALEQGKDVFAVPGNITSAVSEGTNRLIRQGARMVGRAEDVLEELAPQLRGFVRREAHRPPIELTDPERAVCDIMTREPRHVDEIGRASGLSAAAVLAVLLSLELKGAVRQTEGKRFHLA